MDLYLVRHATAQERRARLPDARRALTPKGRKRFEAAARGLEALGIEFDRLYHSPLLRAVETAELLRDRVRGETVVTPRLAEPPTRELWRELQGESVALVGHEPWLSDLALWAMLGERVVDALGGVPALHLGKGSVVVLAGEPRPGRMTLSALLPRSVLELLGGG